MGEKINWDKFQYPKSCGLKPRAKIALKKAAASGIYHPFRICKLGQSGKCPMEVERECFDRAMDVIISEKPKPK